jgi:hypothetical protein
METQGSTPVDDLECTSWWQLVATSENGTLRYVYQDSLTSTSLVTDSTGAQTGATMKYLPFGGARSGSAPIDKRHVLSVVEGSTDPRLDGTGLYYYIARYS